MRADRTEQDLGGGVQDRQGWEGKRRNGERRVRMEGRGGRRREGEGGFHETQESGCCRGRLFVWRDWDVVENWGR